ncbi:hypothetical protein [Absidia glauca]|uniref:Uncharacterized protein n=1 Tax=Absidia glauca TaxID=4829 RepID=A0A163JKU6_ABSGL|nr:hypothetical protein [Absidia glauca]
MLNLLVLESREHTAEMRLTSSFRHNNQRSGGFNKRQTHHCPPPRYDTSKPEAIKQLLGTIWVDNPHNDSINSRYGFLVAWAKDIAITTNDTFFIGPAAKHIWTNVKKVCQNLMIRNLTKEAADGRIPLDDCINEWAAHYLLRRQLQQIADSNNDRQSYDLFAEFTSFGDSSSEDDETSLPRPGTSSTIPPRRGASNTTTTTTNDKGKERAVVP